MSKILVTGGAGFIGTNLIKQLSKDGYDVHSLDDYSVGKKENHIFGVDYIESKTYNINRIFGKTDKFDAVFHLGEYSRIATSFDEINKVWISNSLGTFEVMEFCKRTKTKIIYAGSSTRFAEEGIHHSPYSFTKAKSSELVKNYNKWFGIPYSICYFYNVFGSGYDSAQYSGYESVISVFEKQYLKGLPLTICGNGHQRRSFTYVDDIVNGLLLAWKHGDNEEYQLNNPKEYSILEIAHMFSDDIKFIKERPGDRTTSITTNNNARDILKWETTMNIIEWIENIKDEKNR